MSLVCVWMRACSCVYACFSCSLTWCLPLLEAKACHLLRDESKNRGEQSGDTRYTCVFVSIALCACACVWILQAGAPWDKTRWSPQAKQVGPVYLLHSGSCQFRFQLSCNTVQTVLPKTPHLIALLLHLHLLFQFCSVCLYHPYIASIYIFISFFFNLSYYWAFYSEEFPTNST